MRKTTRSLSLNSELLGAPGALHAQDEIFKSADEMVSSIDSLIQYLNKRYPNDALPDNSSVMGFIIERMNVTFTREVEEIEVETNFAKNKVTILAPLVSRESKRDREDRRIRLLKDFLPTMKEAQLRATIQLYRTLSIEARKLLLESERPRRPSRSRRKSV